MPLRRWSESPG